MGVLGGGLRRGAPDPPYSLPFGYEGDGGRRNGTAQVTFLGAVPAPAAAIFDPDLRASGTGTAGTRRTCPYPASPPPSGSSPAGTGAPPLSHPVATARSGGGRTWSRLPGAFGPSSSPEDAAETG